RRTISTRMPSDGCFFGGRPRLFPEVVVFFFVVVFFAAVVFRAVPVLDPADLFLVAFAMQTFLPLSFRLYSAKLTAIKIIPMITQYKAKTFNLILVTIRSMTRIVKYPTIP